MNKDTAKDYLPLVQALSEGKSIQFNANTWDQPNWIDVDRLLDSNPAQAYRIKPEPREIWVNRYADGLDGPVIYPTEESAKHCGPPSSRAIKYREVLE